MVRAHDATGLRIVADNFLRSVIDTEAESEGQSRAFHVNSPRMKPISCKSSWFAGGPHDYASARVLPFITERIDGRS